MGGGEWRGKGRSTKALGRDGGENDPPRSEALAQLGRRRAASQGPSLGAANASLPGRRRPRGEGSWAKGMDDFQSSLAQLSHPPGGSQGGAGT